MSAAKSVRPRTRDQAVIAQVNDPTSASRAVEKLAASIQAAPERSVQIADLAIGANRVVTGLSRKAAGCTLTPTVADATFAWSFAADGDRVAVITVIGAAQPKCPLEFY